MYNNAVDVHVITTFNEIRGHILETS